MKIMIGLRDVNHSVIFHGTIELADTPGEIAQLLEVHVPELGLSRPLFLAITRTTPPPGLLDDYQPGAAYLDGAGVTDEAAILDRILYALIRIFERAP